MAARFGVAASTVVKSSQRYRAIGSVAPGKSTTLLTILGLVRSWSGRLSLDGAELGWDAAEIVKKGIAIVPEGRRVFASVTIDENLQMGAEARRSTWAEYGDELDRISTTFPVLKEGRHDGGGVLSGGQQQMLAMGRALMARPHYLLMDEPSKGLSPVMLA